MRERGRQTDLGQVALPKPGEDLLPSLAEDSRSSSNKRFACAYCGQHYAVDSSWQEQSKVWLRCGRTFKPEPLAAVGVPSSGGGGADMAPGQTAAAPRAAGISAATPHEASAKISGCDRGAGPAGGVFLRHLSVDLLALFTPLILAGLMGLGLLASTLPGRPVLVFALVACPLIGYFVTVRLCRLVRRSGGIAALHRYLGGTVMSFLFWAIVSSGALWLTADRVDEGTGLALSLVWLFGAVTFVGVFIVWGWSASRVWAGQTGDEGPAVPWWR